MPTSRATRVTSAAKELSWSTMVLMVFLSSRISPCASTVIFLLRSPFATAVVTWAMLRTWLVRFPARPFTLSVRSFHVPDTPRTTACPPSLPSVPTSRATRVTSPAKALSCSTMVFTVRAVCRNCPSMGRPSTSSAMVWERSPLATAVMTRDISEVGRTRSSTRVLTSSTSSAQEPTAVPSGRRWVTLPSLPTTRPTRATSRAMRSLVSRTSLKASAILPGRPVQSSGRRTEKSPLR